MYTSVFLVSRKTFHIAIYLHCDAVFILVFYDSLVFKSNIK